MSFRLTVLALKLHVQTQNGMDDAPTATDAHSLPTFAWSFCGTSIVVYSSEGCSVPSMLLADAKSLRRRHAGPKPWTLLHAVAQVFHILGFGNTVMLHSMQINAVKST